MYVWQLSDMVPAAELGAQKKHYDEVVAQLQNQITVQVIIVSMYVCMYVCMYVNDTVYDTMYVCV